MQLVRVQVEGAARLGVVRGGNVSLLAGETFVDGIDGIVRGGQDCLARVQEYVDRAFEHIPLDSAALLAPVTNPSKIVAVGLNYFDHAAESGMELPAQPLLFAKFPSSIAAPQQPVQWPEGCTSQVDWEAELAVVVGTRLRAASPQQALDGVFGYTAANDVSARDVQFGDGQWVRGKSFDTFCPLGPVLVTADEFGDPQQKAIRSIVNGVVMQEASTADMIFPVADLLSTISAQITLIPGDIVLTGTPPGVGAFREPPLFLTAGDEVAVEIEGIGTLRSPIAGATPSHAAGVSW